MAIVDFHAHFFSRPFFEALAALSPLPGSVPEKLTRAAEKAKIELPSADLGAHVQRWLAELDRHGVARMATFSSLPEETPAVAQAAASSGGRLVPFALVNPKMPGCAEKVAELIDHKAFGGVLLFPALHHYDLAGAEAQPLFEVLAARRAVAFVHCGLLVVKLRDLLGIPSVTDLAFANPLRVIPTAQTHTGARFVIPHFGAGFLRETLMAGAQCKNVFVDTSSSHSWRATQAAPISLKDVFARALGVFGAERILFGTDSNTFPAGWRVERYEEQHSILTALGLPAADQERIFSGNAERLFARD